MTSHTQDLQIAQLIRTTVLALNDVIGMQRLARAVNLATMLARELVTHQSSTATLIDLRTRPTASRRRATIRQPMLLAPRLESRDATDHTRLREGHQYPLAWSLHTAIDGASGLGEGCATREAGAPQRGASEDSRKPQR